jgi:methylenetetrahydrofolate reductase (NADPH)
MITARIKERFYRREPVFSFEFFPPKTDKGEAALRRAIEALVPLNPTFVSVTYGAGGGTRDKTRDIVRSIRKDYGLSVMAHVTCVGHTADEVRALLQEYADHGIENVLALRGDPPRGDVEWKLVMGGPEHAIDVVRIARAMGRFSVGVAGFPEKHPQAPSPEEDIRRLREKVEAGADFVITQLFFDNDLYFDFVSRARKAGVTVPILPGLMPVTRVGQIEKFTELSGCTIPQALQRHLAACGNDEARVQEVGLAYCSAQCADLLRRGAPGLHFFTLNQSRACHTIYAALNALGFWA